MDSNEKMSYEEAFRRVEEIALKLETEEVGLDEAVNLYKEAVDLTLYLKKELDTAESTVIMLKKKLDGTFEEDSFIY